MDAESTSSLPAGLVNQMTHQLVSASVKPTFFDVVGNAPSLQPYTLYKQPIQLYPFYLSSKSFLAMCGRQMRAFASKGRGGANFRDSKDGSVLFLFFRTIRPTVTKSVYMWVIGYGGIRITMDQVSDLKRLKIYKPQKRIFEYFSTECSRLGELEACHNGENCDINFCYFTWLIL